MDGKKSRRRRVSSAIAREKVISSKMLDLLEELIEEKKVPATVMLEYVKRAGIKHEEELKELKSRNDLLKAKIKELERGELAEAQFERVIEALGRYRMPDHNNE